MHDVIDSDLAARLEAHAQEPGHRAPVLVSSDRALDREALEATGMDVARVSNEGTIASGTVDRAALNQLAELEGVVRIESDNRDMHALGD